jgi:hypothetical protein
MAVSADARSFRPAALDSFDAYGTAFLMGPTGRYPLAQGTLAVVDDAGPDGAGGVVPNPHGRALRCTGIGSYLEEAFYFTAAPAFPSVYPRVNEVWRDIDSVYCSVWVNIPPDAPGFALIEWWGWDPDDPTQTWTFCRLEHQGGGLLGFEGGESLAGGGVPPGEWCQVQFRVSHYSGSAGEGQLKNTCAVRVAHPDFGGTTVLGQDEEDPDLGWNTIATKFFDVPQYAQIAGVRVGMVPLAGGSSGDSPEAYITLDDYCAGTVDVRYEAAQLFPSGLPVDWYDGLWVECCALTGPALQPPLERSDPGGGPAAVEGAATAWEAVDERPAHDGDATRLSMADSAGVEGFARAPITRQVFGSDEIVCALGMPTFGAQAPGGATDRYGWVQVFGVANTLDQTAAEAEHYCPLRPPEHPAYGCGVPLWWGPQMPHPTGDEEGLQEGQWWYFDDSDVDAAEVFVQAPLGHWVTSVAVDIAHTSAAVLPPFPSGAGRTWVVWWPEGG